MKPHCFKIFLLAILCFAQSASRAEDIDLFAGATAAAGTAPNLLLVIDNAGSFSASAPDCQIDGVNASLSGSAGGIEQCALYSVISGMPVTPTASVNIGVMAYKAGNVVDYLGNNCRGSANAGGCLLYPLTGLTTATKPALLDWIKSWRTSGNGAGAVKANNQATAATMQEAWAYMAGKTGLSGTNYASIAPVAGCLKNFVVFIGNSYGPNGSPGDSTGDSGPLNALLGSNTTLLMNASPVPTKTSIINSTSNDNITSCGTVSFPNTHENRGYYLDEWSRYMREQNITTYTIGVISSACKAEYAWILNSTATQGGGKYFPTTNFAQLKAAFETILSEVQSTNSAFASVSLPVSVNTQGTYLNQVFIGMFRPDADSLPRWAGNLKQYKMGMLNGALKLLDASTTPTSAISASGSDFIAECARSFWTPALADTDTYWNYFLKPNCTGYAAASNTPDGNIVEKGGQAYMLRSMTPANRRVTTCSPVFASCTSLTPFNTSSTTNGLLGSSGSTDTGTTVTQTTLVNWARGLNSKTLPTNDESATVAATAMRPSVHGDVVHSRPVAINFGTDAIPRVMVFYGANDGALRAINGNRPDKNAANIGTVAAGPGQEMWAFIPPEFYSSIKRLYDNTSTILVRDGTGATKIAGTAKSYGMDGTIVGHKTASGDAWIYATMRRGGRAMYAFTVNSSTLAVTLKWKRGCGINSTTDGSATTCTNDGTNGDFTRIGQTWAAPKVIFASGYLSGNSPLLVMGGGYDASCEDAMSYSCTTATTTGNRIYIMDADSGVLKNTFSTDRGVTGDVVFIKDSSGKVTFGYAADLGGNVYRISGISANVAIGSTDPSLWTITKIASLGCATATTCTAPANRKFIFGPDVTVDGATNVLLLGSGDREKPLNTANTTSNYFFKINDKPTETGYLSTESSANCPGASVMCLNSLLPVTSGTIATTANLNTKKGWYLALQANEQVVTSAVTVFGEVYFSTHQPKVTAQGSCSANLGNTRSYSVLYKNGAKPDGTTGDPFVLLTGGGLPPSPVAGKVTLDDGTTVPFIIGALGPLETKQLTGAAGTSNLSKIRSYWYIQK